jgi:hypothetical protein
MPPRYQPSHAHQDPLDDASFDELTKRVASGTLSRAQALKMMTGAALAALVGGSVVTEETEAATDQVCRNKPVINNTQCTEVSPAVSCSPTNNIGCRCTKTVNGDIRCADLSRSACPTRDECDRNRDCDPGEVCAKVGGCCNGSRRNLCVPLCTD